jgi:mono/diheme cytochrome c family protein
MKTLCLLVLTSLATSLAGRAATADAAAGSEARRAEVLKVFRNDVTPFLKNYCLECHGDKKRKGGVSFAKVFNRPEGGEFRRQWQVSLTNVREHEMPPREADKQPSEAERKQFADWIGTIKFLSVKDPGAFVIRRLTKAEYGNTLRDLLGVDPAVAAELPEDVPGAGYMNALSPLQTEQYLGVAQVALDQALGPVGKPTKLAKSLLGEPPSPRSDAREAARKVARSFARSAFRRPPSEDEIEMLLKVFDLGRENQLAYPAALRLMLKAVLVSPQFLFITPAQAAEPGQAIVPLDDYQLASRLSYFLWATMPDAELMSLADKGKLHEPAVLRAQVKRLLADKRSRAVFDGFGAQWLGVGGLKEKTFDTAKFPQMTPALRAAMYDEARLFFESIVRENRSVVNFVNGDYTYLNGTLAPLYGLEKQVKGADMRRVKLADANRGGILGMPGVLAVTSMPERTSAVKRGVWVLEQVLGQHVPPAPANVPTLEKQDRQKVANLTLRQRTELHRTNPACANCHKLLDPIGFGLENFDAIGRWRDRDDSGGAIDAAGELPGGKRFATPKELKAIIASRSDDLARNLTEKLLAYALCRELEGYDQLIADQLAETLARDGYRMQTLITEIVTSYPFLNRRVQTTVTTNAK